MTVRASTAPRLKDTRAFRKMWADGISPTEIGNTVNLTARRVSDLARSYGYPRRTREGAMTGVMPARPAEDDHHVAAEVPIAQPEQTDQRWSADQDAKILTAAGRYAEVSALAKTFDRKITAVLQRWHQLRVR